MYCLSAGSPPQEQTVHQTDEVTAQIPASQLLKPEDESSESIFFVCACVNHSSSFHSSGGAFRTRLAQFFVVKGTLRSSFECHVL